MRLEARVAANLAPRRQRGLLPATTLRTMRLDGDGLFEVHVGSQSLGQFAQGSRVDFRQLLGGGVPSFRITGIDPGADATNRRGLPPSNSPSTPRSPTSR